MPKLENINFFSNVRFLFRRFKEALNRITSDKRGWSSQLKKMSSFDCFSKTEIGPFAIRQPILSKTRHFYQRNSQNYFWRISVGKFLPFKFSVTITGEWSISSKSLWMSWLKKSLIRFWLKLYLSSYKFPRKMILNIQIFCFTDLGIQ